MASQSAQNDQTPISVWDFQNRLQKADGRSIRFARGFLKSKPDRWFPAFPGEWMPLLHSLGLLAKVNHVEAKVELPDTIEIGYGGSVDGESFGLFFDREAVRVIIESVVPGSFPEVRDLVLEYFARRFIATLSTTWSGGSSWEIAFDNRIDPFSTKFTGSIHIELSINNTPMSLWLGLGERLVEKLDGLWRRQISSASKIDQQVDVHIEIAQLAVPPADLVAYSRSGTVIDLEVPVSDIVTVRSQGRSLFVAKLMNLDGRLGLETLPIPPSNQILPDGMTRVAIEFGKITLDPLLLSEYSQAGILWDTGLGISENVLMVINGETVARSILCEYQGRFALSVS